MDRDEVLALGTRRRVYRAIEDRPGMHLRALARLLEMPLSTLRHHLRYLEDHGLIVAEKDGQYARYFPTRTLSAEDKEVLSVLRREKPRRILIELLDQQGEAWYQDLLSALGYPSSTLGLYLKELIDRGLVDRVPAGRTSLYRVNDPDRVLGLLVRYEESFLDRWVDRVLEIVEEAPAREEDGREDR